MPVQLIDRTFRILSALAESPEPLGITRLSQMTGESVSSVHRLLASLSTHEVVTQGEGKRYRLGVGVLHLAHGFHQHNAIVAVARPHVLELARRTNETVFLSELIGESVVCIDSAESPRRIPFFAKIGQRTPPNAAASARAILAYREDGFAQHILMTSELEAFTSRTPTTVDVALAEIELSRARGYASCDQEIEDGVSAIAVPVLDSYRNAIASVTIVAPSDRLLEPTRTALVDRLWDGAEIISLNLGYRGPSLRPDKTNRAGESHKVVHGSADGHPSLSRRTETH